MASFISGKHLNAIISQLLKLIFWERRFCICGDIATPLSDFPPDTSYVVELEVPASAEVVAVIAVEIVFDADAVDVVKTVVG